ncbi:MAG: YceI family protein [bacterium]
MRSKSTLILPFIILFLASGVRAADKYNIDPVHSYIGFAVKHMVISTVKGNFKDFSGTILYDETDMTQSSVSFKIVTKSINTDNERRDNHLRNDDFFNAEKFPEISFVSKTIKKSEDGYIAVGDLTIRDVTKEVEIPFQLGGPIPGRRNSRRIGVEGELKINRKDYGVKFNRALDNGGLVVANEVKIEIHIEAVNRPESSN